MTAPATTPGLRSNRRPGKSEVPCYFNEGTLGINNDYVQVTNEANFEFDKNNAFTIEYWAKPDNTVTSHQAPVTKMPYTLLQTYGQGYQIDHNF